MCKLSTPNKENSLPVPKFESRKGYMDFLRSQMVSPEEDEEEYFGETRGRPRLLKTYIMESNRGLPINNEGLELGISAKETGLQDVTVFDVKSGSKNARFIVDSSDKRFWQLHTTALAEDARTLFDKLVFSPKGTFDKVWLPTRMIKEIADLPTNQFRGFGLDYADFFELNNEQSENSLAELTMRVTGSNSLLALKALKRETKLEKSLATSLIRVRRGDRQEYVIDELGYDGRFSARGGTSIDGYISLIEITTKKYRNLIESIERNSLGIKEVDGRTLVEGRAFDLNFTREIVDLDNFLEILLSSKQPFRLWGLKNRLSGDTCQVFGVDLHTGDSIDLEISPYLMRVYLPENSCGNTILRLYTNLQHYFDSTVKLNEEELETGE